jgi:hypothetical protein
MYGSSQILSPEDPRRQQPPYKYDLFGVTNHYGTLRSGHCMYFILFFRLHRTDHTISQIHRLFLPLAGGDIVMIAE